MPNVGAITTAESVALARYAEAVGCDAVSAVTPFFLKPSQDELFEHYRAICAAVKLPVLAYNIPKRTGGVSLSVATVSRLAREVSNFAGIKDSTGDLTSAAEMVQASPPGFRVFMGRDTLIFGALLYGCAGAVAATANVAPALVVGIHDAVMAADLPKARQLQAKLAPVRRLFTIGSHPLGLKEAMVQLGTIECGRCRLPTLDITPAQKDEVKDILGVEAGFIGPHNNKLKKIGDVCLKEGIYIGGANRAGFHTSNSEGYEDGPYIAPDESYLIFESGREGVDGSLDLFIVFKNNDGQWGTPVNMGPKINTESYERFARVSSDGRY